jgi:hypothetical protein
VRLYEAPIEGKEVVTHTLHIKRNLDIHSEVQPDSKISTDKEIVLTYVCVSRAETEKSEQMIKTTDDVITKDHAKIIK